MPSCRGYPSCVFLTLALICLAIVCKPEFADAHRHSKRRSADYAGKREAAEPLRGGDRRFKKPSRGEKDLKRQTTVESKEEEGSRSSKDFKVTVRTDKGRYRGRVQEVFPGTKVAIFLGMRYGEPPAGKLRFKRSRPVRKWMGVRDALRYSNTCYQWRDNTFGIGYPGTDMWNPNTELSEDCLFVNVWTPVSAKFSDKKLSFTRRQLPVMVWIYGGGFYSGTSSLDVYNGKWLAATQEVVLVSINYRIAALGFLTFGTADAPGNAGLWDQNLALRWIRDNIHHFGGDESRITLFGESAGAASISIHMMSEHSNGLFQNAILQSASAVSPWAILSVDEMKRRANRLAGALGCKKSGNDTDLDEAERAKKMMECMYSTKAQTIVDVEIGMEDLGTARFQNAAVIDEDFLTREAVERLKNGDFVSDVNLLAGFNGNEGNYFLAYSTEGFRNISVNVPINYAQYRSGVSKGLWGYPWRPMDEAPPMCISNVTLDAIDFVYTNFEATLSDRNRCERQNTSFFCTADDVIGSDRVNGNSYKEILDHIIGDSNFVCPVIDFIKKTKVAREGAYAGSGDEPDTGRGAKFLYKFLHRSSQTPWPEWMGALHGYEIEFAFGIPMDKAKNYTEQEIELSKRMMRYWANFAKSGNPNQPESDAPGVAYVRDPPHWPEYDPGRQASLVFDIEPTEVNNPVPEAVNYVEEMTKNKHCSFWTDYYPVIRKNVAQIESSLCVKPSPSTSCNAASTVASTSKITFSFYVFLILALHHLPEVSYWISY